jgi:NAD(P)-dependent dehydrogenase (short-subunit alcohol dehydrogenase family)
VAGPLISVGEIIVALFPRAWDMTKPEMADEIVREVGHVDILIANLAYPHSYAPAHEKTDADLEYAMQRIMYPLHRLTRAVLLQMLERKRGKIVVVGSATSLRGRASRRVIWLYPVPDLVLLTVLSCPSYGVTPTPAISATVPRAAPRCCR